MKKSAKVGGTRKKVLSITGLFAVVIMFFLYMIPFILILLNSFKYKRDIIKNPFSLITKKGYTIENYITAFEKMNFLRAFGNSLFVTGLSTIAVIILSAMVAYFLL